MLVLEALRRRGQSRLEQMSFEILVTARVDSEFKHELERRLGEILARGSVSQETVADLRRTALSVYNRNVSRVPPEQHAHLEATARLRVPQDPDDVPTAALALALNTGVWTEDRHFFGCGLPVWRTDVLYATLDQDATSDQDNAP